ncbi:energy-coupling factor transporter ATPase [Bacillus piscicola]|uniref:energy-coupling factor transporter ATPase n=1 Tax=Bacillus piscicola TaxID=1632684 RepID=UPI001F089934|nr:energy-coupling factor transporter ATPase [Bacillus piscicola]
MKVVFERVSHSYMTKTPFEKQALKKVSTVFEGGKVTAVIGQTGSGKSTLVQHINGLLRPAAGKIIIGNREITPKTKSKTLKELRQQVGMVFQYPEHQLFEETVEKDLLFGPRNAGFPEAETKRKLPELLKRVGLNDTFLSRSPFELSGGQMRRVALAGILAMDPEVLILDEPTAGLDPQGKKEIVTLLKVWQQQTKRTMILITHNMEEAAELADDIRVMEAGEIVLEGITEDIFTRDKELSALNLDVPDRVKILKFLSTAVSVTFTNCFLPAERAADELEATPKQRGLP